MPEVPPAPVSEPPTLQEVLWRVQAGDRGENDPELRQRIDAAFAKHLPRLRAHIAAELRSFPAEQVEDTLQNTMVVAWRKLAEHRGRAFRAWLFEIASNECANVRRKRREILPGDDELFEAHSAAQTAYAALRSEERERVLREVAARVLDPVEQEVVYMRYELELPREEIARMAGLPGPDAVRVILQRTRRALVRELEKTLEELGHGRSLVFGDSVG